MAGCTKCVTSLKWNQPLGFTFCKPFTEDQNVEIGSYEEKDGEHVMMPLGKLRLMRPGIIFVSRFGEVED